MSDSHNQQSLKYTHERIIMDASSAINIYASGQMANILQTMPLPVAINEYVYKVELLTLPSVKESTREKIDVEPLIDQGILEVVALCPGDEQRDAINFAALGMGNGEAFTSGIAVGRGWAIAIDDRPAIACLHREAPHIQTISTPELLEHWARVSEVPTEKAREALQNITRFGRYSPPGDHPLSRWWKTLAKIH